MSQTPHSPSQLQLIHENSETVQIQVPDKSIISKEEKMNCIAVNGDPALTTHCDGDELSKVQTPIAICGIALRLPGGLKTPEQFWDFLIDGKDGRVRVPSSRYNISAFYEDNGKPTTIPTEYGYFLDDDLGALDTSFFSMPRSEVEQANPEQRLMLEVVRECLEDAGEANWRGKCVGCYMGSFGEDWAEMATRENQGWGNYRLSGPADFVLSNRISYEMDFRGPSVTIRTACSAGLTGLNEACMALSKGDCQTAIVGGTNLIMTPTLTSTLADQGVLAKDGCCKTFSADADGYARGEAIVAVYIKRLEDAINDGDPVRAVIRGTAINSDGKTPSFSQPSTDAHETLIRRAYTVAGITDYSMTGFVECHGTGTPTGDPIETKAVGRVFGKSGVYIGSVKPNVGHTEGASGLVSLIKVILSLEHSVIPPNIRFSQPNPNIPFESAKLTVPLQPTNWPRDLIKRASINSFGAGGANAHVIIDSASNFRLHKQSQRSLDSHHLLVFSANSASSLAKLVQNYQKYIESNPEKVADLAYTLANRREHLAFRSFGIANRANLGAPTQATKTVTSSAVLMVFTGQGAQWPLMGIELLRSNLTFRATIQQLDSYLQDTKEHTPRWRIEEELSKPGNKSQIHKAEYAQPICTAIQIALVDCLSELGIRPQAVVGHSSGEIAAAYASGGLSAREAIITAFYRGVVGSLSTKAGAMAAVGMSWSDTEKHLLPRVNIACDNAPKSVTISGDAHQVDTVIAGIREACPDVLVRNLQVDKAYHSYHMLDLSDRYEALIASKITGRSPAIPFFSSVTGELLQDGCILGPAYWRQNMESPVLFQAAVLSMTRHGAGESPVLLEIGPHSALAGPLRQIISHAAKNAHYVSAMTRNKNTMESYLSAVGYLYSFQVPIKFGSLIPTGRCLSDLPRYPWNHEVTFWSESRLSREYRLRKYPHHDLLGIRTLESTSLEPSWRNLLHLNTVPWIRDHRVGEDIVFPMVGYITIAGEAARQISGIPEAFCVKRFVMSAALVLGEGNPTEIITTFRRRSLTDTQDSQWWTFTIASHNGSVWKKHCTGEVMAHSESLGSGNVVPPLPRKIDSKTFYSIRTGGIHLGPAFRNMTGISSDTRRQRTAITVLNGKQSDAHKYHIHPCSLDVILQLGIYNQIHGYTRDQQTWLPVSVEELNIHRCTSNLAAESWLRLKDGYVWLNEAKAVHDGKVMIKMSGLKAARDYDMDLMESTDSHGAARLEWGPDIDFTKIQDLIASPANLSAYMPPLEELGRLCMLYARQYLVESQTVDLRREKFQVWLNEQPNFQSLNSLEDFSSQEVLKRINDNVRQLETTAAAPAGLVLQAICGNLETLLSTQDTSWEDVVSAQTRADLLSLLKAYDLSTFLRKLTHCKPSLRVLEIGFSKDGPSRHILDCLTLPHGRTLCSKYTFASMDNVLPQQSEMKFANLHFASLNINEDLVLQGFTAEYYDLIIAVHISHKTNNYSAALKNLKSLLHFEGHMFLQELCPSSNWVNFFRQFRHGRWLSESTERDHQPHADMKRFQTDIRAAGFEVSETMGLDGAHHLNTLALVQSPRSRLPLCQVSILTHNENSVPGQLKSILEAEGYVISHCTLQDTIPPGQDVIVMFDQDASFFGNIDSTAFEELKLFLLRISKSGVFWVTHHCQMHVSDPSYSEIVGFSRTMRSELLIDFATCEVDSFDTDADSIVKVFEKFRRRNPDEALRPDFEYVIHDGVINVGRFYPFELKQSLMSTQGSDRAVLEIGVPGRINTLQWTGKPTSELLGQDEVEIEVYAAGLNFRDVLVALKVMEFPPLTLGWEGSGIVRRLGSDVINLKVGDRVAAFGSNMLATVATVKAAGVVKIPETLGFIEAASMFFSYLTALYSMTTIGGLEKGGSVLIHSACGGVGLAAVQLARMLEVEVYATVGSEEKVQTLEQNYDIPRERIFNSRDASFEDGVMRETQGKGVDLVLNSLAGELLHASWRCVAQFGKLIELGKKDLVGHGKLDMDVFLGNRSYCSVDMGSFPFLRKKVLSGLMTTIVQLLRDGRIRPLQPVKVFDATKVQEAFRYMQPGQHVGRICISLRDSPYAPFKAIVMAAPKTLKLREDVSYLLVGGLGGLGRAISTWMVEHGARSLIYLSRSAGLGADDQSFASELHSMDCKVHFIPGSVTSPDDVYRAITASPLVLKGILQMSAVFVDENFSRMTIDQWITASSPKVKGTWNLHHALISAGLDLDFFVLFSSLSGIVGQPGQANYAGANTFLDAFVQYRNTLGLAASAIDIGAVDDIGHISQTPGLMQKMSGAGFKAVKEQELLDALTLVMEPQETANKGSYEDRSRFGDPNTFVLGLNSTIPLNDPANRAIWKRDRRMGIYHNTTLSTSSVTAASASIKTYIANAKLNPSILKSPDACSFLANEIGKKLFQLLLKPVEDLHTEMSLVDLGVDSLLGIELRQWWRQVFGLDISVLEMLGTGTLDALGKFAAEKLLKEMVD